MNEINLQGNAAPKTFLALVSDSLNLMAFVMLQSQTKVSVGNISGMIANPHKQPSNISTSARD